MSAWGTKHGPVPKRAPVDPADLCCDAPELETFRDEEAGHVSVRCRACGWQIGKPKRGGAGLGALGKGKEVQS